MDINLLESIGQYEEAKAFWQELQKVENQVIAAENLFAITKCEEVLKELWCLKKHANSLRRATGVK